MHVSQDPPPSHARRLLRDCAVRARDRETDLSAPEVAGVWILRAFLVLMIGQIFYVAHYKETNQPILLASALFGILASATFLVVPTTRPRTLKVVELGVLLTFCLHVAGHLYAWYYNIPNYDKLVHAIGGFLLAAIAFALSQATSWIWNWRRVTPGQAFWFCFSFAMTGGTAWELVEFAMDSLFGTAEQGGLLDTNLDIVADTLGALAGASLVRSLTRRAIESGADSVAETPKVNPLDSGASPADVVRGRGAA